MSKHNQNRLYHILLHFHPAEYILNIPVYMQALGFPSGVGIVKWVAGGTAGLEWGSSCWYWRGPRRRWTSTSFHSTPRPGNWQDLLELLPRTNQAQH